MNKLSVVLKGSLYTGNTIIYTALMGILLLGSHPVFALCDSRIELSNPVANFQVLSDGAVLDRKTGLLWMQCSLGQSGQDCQGGTALAITWQQALNVVHASTFLGYTDWRLPNAKELASLVEKACHTPAIHEDLFPATSPAWYWTSTPYVAAGGQAWVIDFAHGYSAAIPKAGSAYVRMVRSGY